MGQDVLRSDIEAPTRLLFQEASIFYRSRIYNIINPMRYNILKVPFNNNNIIIEFYRTQKSLYNIILTYCVVPTGWKRFAQSHTAV